MQNWILVAGSDEARFVECRRVLTAHEYDVFPLRRVPIRSGFRNIGKPAQDFVETDSWLGLVGWGEGADDFVRAYFEYFAIHPPGALVLIDPRVSVFSLNELACPYLIVSSMLEPEYVQAVKHHRQRYGDLTAIEKSHSAPKLLDGIAHWLDRSARRARKLAA